MNDAFRFDGRNLDAGFWDRLLASTPQQIHDFLTSADSLPAPEHRKVKTIAIFYHRYCCGGIERVLSEQFAYFLNLGYKVVFLTEEPPSGNDFALPPQVVRVQIPSRDPLARLNALREIFERHDVDLYYTHASFARQTLWDLLIVRYILKRRVIVHAHGIFPCSLVWGEDDLQQRLDMYRLADHLVVLSRADAFYYRAYGINCTYLPNPVPVIARQEGLTENRFQSKLVLVVGRVCAVKQTLEALRVASEMRAIDQEVHFLIVGNHDDATYWRRVQMEYRRQGLGGTVDFQDYTKDVDSLYRKGSLLLMTSRLEGYPMAMAEAMGYGLPIVSYEMPYVEFMREPESGVLTVPQGDAVGAARCIDNVFQDRGLYEKLSCQARTSYERIPSDEALQKAYAGIVASAMSDMKPAGEDLADARAAFESLMPQMRVCLKAYYDRGWADGVADDRKRRATRSADALPASGRIRKVRKGVPGLSVVVPVYNVENYLRQSLDSVVGQTMRDIEIICVNDGSTDGSGKILAEYAARDPRIRIVDKPNGGLSSARNAGMAVAKGEYLLFFDSDDILATDAAERLVACAEESSLDLLFYDADCFPDSPEAAAQAKSYANYYRRSQGYAKPRQGAELIADMMANSDYLCSACFEIWRTDFLRNRNLKFTEGILHEDTEFTFRASLLAKRAAHLNRTLFHRRVRARGSIMAGVTRFESSYGAFRAYVGMRECFDRLGRRVAGEAWILKEMADVLSVARERYGKLDSAERAKLQDVSEVRYRSLFGELVADPADGRGGPRALKGDVRRRDDSADGSIKVSVIVPVYNMGRFVGECLESVLGQTLREIEVICVDDGSTDESPAVLAGFAKRDPRVKVMTQKNQGAFAARNAALDLARGQFVIFMDPDDWYCDADALRTLYAEAVANKVKICGGELVEMLSKGIPKPLPAGYRPSYCYRRGGFFEFAEYQYFGWYTRFIFDRQMIEENNIRFPPYLRYQDPPFLVRAMIAAGRFYAIKRAMYAVRVDHKTINWQSKGCKKLVDYMAGNAELYDLARIHGLQDLSRRQRENLVSTGMLEEILKNLDNESVRNGLMDMFCSMGPAASGEALRLLSARRAAASGGIDASGRAVAVRMSVLQRMIKCYHDEGFWYTLKRLLQLGRK